MTDQEKERMRKLEVFAQNLAHCHCCDAYLDCFDDCPIKMESLNGGMQDRYNIMMKAREALR